MVKGKSNKSLPQPNEEKIKAEKLLTDALTEPVKEKVVEAKKEIKKVIKTIQKKISKKDFLDNIFGTGTFNFQSEMMNVLDELNEDNMDKFLDMSKQDKEKLLMKRFTTSNSISKIMKSFK